MPSRREVLSAGLAGGALAAVPALRRAGAAPLATGDGAVPYRVVVDERFPAALALAAAAHARLWNVSAIRGDVTALWYEELALRWRAGPAPIAGMTTTSALFCLERLAWDAQMRLNLRIDHRGDREGRVEHTLAAQPGLITGRDIAGLARADFATVLPPLLARSTQAARGQHEARTFAGARGSLARSPDERLVSWSIGTRVRSAA